VTAAPDVSALRMLRQVRDRIDRDYAEPVGIPALAAAAGYSTAHFIRAFHAAYGETPGAYRTRRRVERACELLRSVNLSVTEICHAVGFTSLGSFSARFSGLMGQSPSAYRAEAARRGGPAPIPGCFALMWRTGLPAPPEPALPADAPAPSASLAPAVSASAPPSRPKHSWPADDHEVLAAPVRHHHDHVNMDSRAVSSASPRPEGRSAISEKRSGPAQP
jgi:AraC-like DNA-binding protein